ncbi:hypothetical protein ACQBAT_00480 [Ornithinimicrobium sp. Y1847]|uniref:hypothetical protein n=1 Tax=Ornithinimicrobium sp. Y1847 TaxID=3405419 RepID=UPI003B670604
MREFLTYALHALIVWVVMRGLVALALSSGSQDLWALAAATTTAVALAGLATAWLTRTARKSVAVVTRRLMPVPLAGGALAAWAAGNYASTTAQIAVAAAAWILGGIASVVLVHLVWRKRRHTETGMRPTFA